MEIQLDYVFEKIINHSYRKTNSTDSKTNSFKLRVAIFSVQEMSNVTANKTHSTA